MSAESICHWFHHLRMEEDEDSNSGPMRVLNLQGGILPSTIDEIIERCKQVRERINYESIKSEDLITISNENNLMSTPGQN